MDSWSSQAALARDRGERRITQDAEITAPRTRAAGAEQLPSNVCTWFDGSPSPSKYQFCFPSNRSSASTAPPNRSASPVNATPALQESECGGGTDAVRRELIRLYDSNAELREQVRNLQTCFRRRSTVLISECEQKWRAYSAELGEALGAEQLRCKEMEKNIAALREELSAAKQTIACFSKTQASFPKEATRSVIKGHLLKEKDNSSSLATHTGPQLVRQEEMMTLKTGMHLQQHKGKDGNTCLLERGRGTENHFCSQSSSLRSQTPNRSFWTDNGIRKKSVITGLRSGQRYPTPPALDTSEQAATLSRSAAYTRPLPLSRASVPQTLADISAFAAATPPRTAAEPWYDEEELKEVVSLSRASRLRLTISPRRFLCQSCMGSLSK
ncbi:hypothetical protein TraAM80_04312 [Trypanosoma rangeli]|uniref:Uncharacterized protein n=1 Tax=Trypanosoma rangeli TaxID=5698 RepID=A0A3R7NFM2_TRYRA|nr:uncharacterized protein TraAM80_04312 [Trypanosoma rangeli]RNF05845.1 hypothetical protein TraAM80_04312 [Trypanosoma rangeli]|eukprot:RNF05845.1 hypothetical protein TraAM80_04312 [Trypanosoma rangeli]